MHKLFLNSIDFKDNIQSLIKKINDESLQLAEQYAQDGYIFKINYFSEQPITYTLEHEVVINYEIEKTERLQYEEKRLQGGL